LLGVVLVGVIQGGVWMLAYHILPV